MDLVEIGIYELMVNVYYHVIIGSKCIRECDRLMKIFRRIMFIIILGKDQFQYNDSL